MFGKVDSDLLQKVDIQANGLQGFLVKALWVTEANTLKNTAAVSILDSIISSQSLLTVKSDCTVDFFITESPQREGKQFANASKSYHRSGCVSPRFNWWPSAMR